MKCKTLLEAMTSCISIGFKVVHDLMVNKNIVKFKATRFLFHILYFIIHIFLTRYNVKNEVMLET